MQVLCKLAMVRGSLLLALLSAPLAGAQTRTNVAGRWRVHGWLGGNSVQLLCTFLQNNNTLQGTCANEQGPIDIYGQSSGPTISWSYTGDVNGTASTITYAGSVTGGRMNGRIVVAPEGDNGRFTAEMVR